MADRYETAQLVDWATVAAIDRFIIKLHQLQDGLRELRILPYLAPLRNVQLILVVVRRRFVKILTTVFQYIGRYICLNICIKQYKYLES